MRSKIMNNHKRSLGKVLSLKNLLMVGLALLLVFLPVILQTPPVFATSATYTTTADSYIDQNASTENYGGDTILRVEARQAPGGTRAR